MLSTKQQDRFNIKSFLEDPRIRQVNHDGKAFYVAADVMAMLSEVPGAPLPEEVHQRLIHGEFDGQPLETLDVAGVMRLAQAVDSPKAEGIKNWLANTASERLEEAEDPE